ncbi:MAG: hypothetical protein H5T42_07800 [Methanothrix sp.]|uniref:hypothetical protein n=1 Tax=Methanothrix sp. TaxID=90426 RepID=UPI000A72683B|nr:hypothetical protein [Methanothrix sp.]MBC7080353.1 hypothetical protein [Methanothrix sp.]NPU87010.1 hypothetical protein [Methanothrix sp.]
MHALLTCIALLSIAALASDQGNLSEEGKSAAHVYVFNRDDDRLRVSLFIDGSLVDSKEVSSENEAEIGTYYLDDGEHSFTITWWDEDTRKSYESSVTATVKYDMPVTLYTEKNDEPEKFYLTVLVRNENDRDLDVCLYIDDKFERCTNAKKSAMTEVGKIKLESGMHNISVRWKDPDTEIEYRKSRSVDLIGDDAVVIYAPKGVAIKKESSRSGDQKTAQEKSSQSSQSSLKKETDSTISSNKSENSSANTAPKTEVSALRTAKQTVERDAEGQNIITNDHMYIYVLIVALAVYLLFRS